MKTLLNLLLTFSLVCLGNSEAVLAGAGGDILQKHYVLDVFCSRENRYEVVGLENKPDMITSEI